MEKRIGVIAIIVQDKTSIPSMNAVLNQYNEIVLGRLGLPLRDRNVYVISLVVEGTTDGIGALTGKLGKLKGVTVKSTLVKGQF